MHALDDSASWYDSATAPGDSPSRPAARAERENIALKQK
jgi:hypothetical protein